MTRPDVAVRTLHPLRVLVIAVLLVGFGAASARAVVAGEHGRAGDRFGTLDLQLREPEGDIYLEGSVTHVRLRDARGRVLVDRSEGNVPLLRKRLAPGRYRLETWQRDCVGICTKLGRDAVPCATDLVVEPRKLVALRLVIAVDRSGRFKRVACTLLPPGISQAVPPSAASGGVLAVSEPRPRARLRSARIDLAVLRPRVGTTVYTSLTRRLYRRPPLTIPLTAGEYVVASALRACRHRQCDDTHCSARIRVLPGRRSAVQLRPRYTSDPVQNGLKCRLRR